MHVSHAGRAATAAVAALAIGRTSSLAAVALSTGICDVSFFLLLMNRVRQMPLIPKLKCIYGGMIPKCDITL